jgi:hypothetical protein
MPPAHIFKNSSILFSLQASKNLLRQRYIALETERVESNAFVKKLQENVFMALMKKATKVDRQGALLNIEKSINGRVILVLIHHPVLLPSVSRMFVKHWKAMTRTPEALKASNDKMPSTIKPQAHKNAAQK